MNREFGVILPRELIRGKEILAVAKEVEKMGYSYVVACDHVVLPNQNEHGEKLKYSLDERYTDPLTLLAAVAAVTNNLKLFTGVLVLPERATALIARQAADVDILSGGKVNLGVGVGWLKEEFDALGAGQVFLRRGLRIEEQIGLLRELWTKESVSFLSEHEKIVSMGINPRPIQQPIPIWIGGTNRKVVDRVVRLGDGWIPRGRAVEFNNIFLPHLTSSLELHNRNPKTLPVMGKVNIRWELGENEWQMEGTNWLENSLVSHLSIGSIGGNESTVENHLEILLKAIKYFK